jgi:penicillin-binding protein 1B
LPDVTGAYTTFANGGVKIDPWFVASIRSANGDVLNEYPPNSKPILDSRVAYLTLALMENVINSGTGGTVRAHGFTAPAAGKTGTSRDAWFAGFTSNLLCVVWIGNDDYFDLKLEGGKTAAIVLTEFMKQAVRLPQYSDTKEFLPPTGVVEVNLDKATNLLADASCPDHYTASFLEGTQPKDTCDVDTINQDSSPKPHDAS